MIKKYAKNVEVSVTTEKLEINRMCCCQESGRWVFVFQDFTKFLYLQITFVNELKHGIKELTNVGWSIQNNAPCAIRSKVSLYSLFIQIPALIHSKDPFYYTKSNSPKYHFQQAQTPNTLHILCIALLAYKYSSSMIPIVTIASLSTTEISLQFTISILHKMQTFHLMHKFVLFFFGFEVYIIT